MKIVDEELNRNRRWEKGDVLKDADNSKVLIVQDSDGSYCLMDITPENSIEGRYSTKRIDVYGYPCSSLKDLYSKYSEEWHKVNAKLVIE